MLLDGREETVRVKGSTFATFAAVVVAFTAGYGWCWLDQLPPGPARGWNAFFVFSVAMGTASSFFLFLWAITNDSDERLGEREERATSELAKIRDRRARLQRIKQP